MNDLPWTSPASNDSAMQIQLHLKTKWPYDYKKTFPRLHLHPTTQPCKYDFTLKPNGVKTKWPIWISPASDDSTMQTRLHLKTKWPYDFKKTSSGNHLHPTTQACKYDFTSKSNDHMIYKTLHWTSPASDDSTMQIRLHLKTKWPYDY